MEALGAAASIIAVLELSGTVLSHIRSAKGATKERKRLRDEVQACDDILQQLQDDAEDSDEATAWSKNIAALEKPGGPLSRLLVTMTMIKVKLEDCSKSEDRSHKIAASLKWPFVAKEVDELLVALEREKTLLGLALTIDTQKLLHKIEETSVKNSQYLKELLQSLENTSISQDGHLLQLEIGVDTIIRIQETQEEHENNRTILDWLSPLDFTSQQNDFIRRRQADTGLWLLQSEEYQHWVTTAKETLFCPGMPGAGKTIITSIVIEDLYERYRSQLDVGIAYIYCNFRRQETQTIDDLFSSILQQLARCKSSIPQEVQDLFHQHQRRQSRPALQEIIATLELVLRGFKRSFIVVDALDECQDSNNCRSKLIQQISGIQTEIALNFFATSRNIPDIMEKFVGTPKIEIQASEADIGQYLAGQMPRLSRCVLWNNTLQDEIIKTITEGAGGMFLLAQLHMESLVGKTTVNSVYAALQRLDSGSNAYDSAYDNAMERINGQLKDHKKLALQVLMWITCAKKPLVICELQHALAVQIGETSLDENDFVDVQEMVSVCAGLVTIDQESNIVRLVHYTTQEYFQRQEIQDRCFPEAQETIFNVCTTYLGFDDFAEGACGDTDNRQALLKKHPFYRYAARNWARHLHLGLVDWGSMTFLKCENKIGSCLEEAASTDTWPRSRYVHRIMFWMNETASQGFSEYRGLTPLHLAAHGGINELVLFLNASHVNEMDCRKRTPLHYAAGKGHVKTVQLLLEKDADTKVIDVHGQSALSYAVERGHTETVRMLLDMGADPNLHEPGQSPMSRAIENDDSEVLQMLIDHKVDIEAREGRRNRTPLMLAANGESAKVLHTLLENGADVHAHDQAGECALMIAARDGWANAGAAAGEESVCLLLKNGATIHERDDLRSFPWRIVDKLNWEEDLDIILRILEAHRPPGL